MVEGARLESVYTPKGYLGFESLTLRHFSQIVLNNSIQPVLLGGLYVIFFVSNFSVDQILSKPTFVLGLQQGSIGFKSILVLFEYSLA